MAGLPWIKVEVALPNHPKIERLEAELGIADGLGLVVRLWCWTAAYYPDGRIPKASSVTMARNALRGLGEDDGSGNDPVTPAACVTALVRAELLDAEGDAFRVHDWDDYHAAHADKAAKNRERQARFREKRRTLASRDSDVTRDVTHE